LAGERLGGVPRVTGVILKAPAETSNFVFLNESGPDFLRGHKHWFEAAVREAGVHDFTWHDLRHTFASRLAMAGENLRTVQELTGHKTINMTCRYAHLAPAQHLAAVEKLAGFNLNTR